MSPRAWFPVSVLVWVLHCVPPSVSYEVCDLSVLCVSRYVMHCAVCCVRDFLHVSCGECFVSCVCVLRVVLFIVCVVTVNGHEGTAALRLLPRGIFRRTRDFLRGATVQFMSMTYSLLLRKDLGGF